MHPIYSLKDTHYFEAHQSWRGREVVDRYNRTIGHVRDILVEEESLEEAVAEQQTLSAHTISADYVVVSIETGPVAHLLRHSPAVILPLAAFKDEGHVLLADADRDDLRAHVGP